MPKLLDISALEQGVQASKTYTDERISDVELSVQQATAEQVQDVLDDVFGTGSPMNYVTFDSDEPRTITPTYTNSGITLQYSLDTETWTDIASKGVTPSAKTIYMRGQAVGTKALFISPITSNSWIFSGDTTNKLRVIGNLNYLLCDTLGDTSTPTTLAPLCYCNMFQGCTSLIEAPELPATTLAINCYNHMFSGCISLSTAPELPATALSQACYQYMFSDCTSLLFAPELPAVTLANHCYLNMFDDCGSLTSLKIHATDNLTASSALTLMLLNVKNTGTLYCKPELTEALLPTPAGWTRVNF